MGDVVHARRPAGRSTQTASRPASAARAWPGAGNAGGGGHDLARISVSAPSSDAPIQRVRWRWSATTSSWSTVGSSSSTSTAPAHSGTTDGEEYEDSYSQAMDTTATPHHRSGTTFMGQSGALKQSSGSTPNADQVREPAVTGTGRKGGSGLHEVIPTNLRGMVASSGNEALVGLQSGLRTSTDYQLFSPSATGTGDVGAHTGFARNATGTGSTHTRGQAPAHDTLREAAELVEDETDPDVVVNTMALAHLSSTAHGQEILQSDYLTGAVPNLTAFGTIGPVAPTGTAPDPNRTGVSRGRHAEREAVKTRTRSLSRSRDPKRQRTRSPSPPRTPIDSTGGGGDYVTGDRTTWPTVPVPSFEGTGWEQYANQGAWLSAPQRHGFDFSAQPPLIFPSTSSSPSVPLSSTTPSVPTTTSPPTLSSLLMPPPSTPSTSSSLLMPPPPTPSSLSSLLMPPPSTTSSLSSLLMPPPSTPSTLSSLLMPPPSMPSSSSSLLMPPPSTPPTTTRGRGRGRATTTTPTTTPRRSTRKRKRPSPP